MSAQNVQDLSWSVVKKKRNSKYSRKFKMPPNRIIEQFVNNSKILITVTIRVKDIQATV